MDARPRYIVTIRVAAGSFLTATAVAAVVAMGSAPASAAASLPSLETPARAIGATPSGTTPALPSDAKDMERPSGQALAESTRGRDVAGGPATPVGGHDIAGGPAASGGDRPAGGGAEAGQLPGAESVSRLDGIRQEMDQAVQMKMVTADQAERFVNQIHERILRGL